MSINKGLIAFVFLVFSCSTGLTQTKKETVDWLNNQTKSSGITNLMGKTDEYGYKSVYCQFNIDGTFIVDVIEFTPANAYKGATKTLKGKIKDLSINSIKYYASDGKFLLAFGCFNGQCITTDNVNLPKVSTTQFNVAVNQDDADRIIKAVKHLVKLFGGKAEPF